MNLADVPGFNKLRFHPAISNFSPILALFSSTGERAENSGKKVIGCPPLSPLEPVLAAGAMGCDLFTGETILQSVMSENTDLVNDAVGAGLSPDFNAWNLIAPGAAASGNNQIPFNALSSVCGFHDDQIKKSLQAMASSSESPLYFWDIPRYTPEFSGWATDFIVRELKQLFAWLAQQTGQKVTADKLSDAIRKSNLLRQDIVEISRLQQSSSPPLPSLEFYFLMSTAGDHMLNAEILHERYQVLINELKGQKIGTAQGTNSSAGKLRVYWLGEDTQEYRIFNELDDYGATLIGSDTRLSFYYEPLPEDGNPVENLAKWLWKMPCNLSTSDRIRVTIPHIKAQKPDALILHSNLGSRGMAGAERMVKDLVESETGLPLLAVESSLPNRNIDRMKLQLEAFIKLNKFRTS